MSFDLPVEVSGFGTNLPWVKNGWRTERFSTSDIIRAAIVAGYGFGGTAIHWRIQAWRLASIRLALDVPPGSTTPLMGQLSHPRAWTDLDFSEKGSVNSLLGNVITKLLCERILNAPRIWFLSLYGHLLNASFTGSKRPDFFTLTSSGEWISLEAKGRSYSPPSRLLAAAKDQASALNKINGTKIAAHVVSWSMSKNGRVGARFHDPEPPERASNLRVDSEKLLTDYYAPAREIINASERMGRVDDIILYEFPAGDFMIGIDPDLESGLPLRTSEVIGKFSGAPAVSFEGDRIRIPQDGIVIIPGRSWPDREVL